MIIECENASRVMERRIIEKKDARMDTRMTLQVRAGDESLPGRELNFEGEICGGRPAAGGRSLASAHVAEAELSPRAIP